MRITIPAAFIDKRGSIQNVIELLSSDRPIRGAGVIRSIAGSERSNHWHREDGHYLYVLEGEMHYWERDVFEPNGAQIVKPVYAGEPEVFLAGDCAFTGPNLWHRTRFPVDTVLLSLSFLPRNHAAHEKDVMR